ncbi:protocadherin Fat 1 [Trichonephila clavipes]|nr:protocadherin Fat 1 [Trichonephila clavipes]
MALVSPTENPKRNVNASCPTLNSPVNKICVQIILVKMVEVVKYIKGASFMCQCKAPYFGQNCERDPCTDQPCLNGGICKLHKDSFKCYCKEPFFGTKCEIVNPCGSKPCQNGGICTVNGDTFNCMCKAPYIGEKCEKMDPCATLPCQNGGVCSVNGDSFNCMCKAPYTGEKCEKVFCDASLCKHGKCQVIGEVQSCL